MSAHQRITAAVVATLAGEQTRDDALRAISEADLAEVLHATIGDQAGELLCAGIAASPGVAVGKICLSVDAVLSVVDAGDEAVLVASETGPEDEPGMRWSTGIVTARGGLASHAAIFARGMGLPAVCGAEGLTIDGDHVVVGDVRIAEGDVITVDGSTGQVFVGEIRVDHEDPPDELEVLLTWADEVRAGRVGVRANADTGEDAAVARRLGAEGIGLCRTEHMFLGTRLPVVRRVLLATDDDERDAALADLLAVQRSDFVEVLEAMDGLPVTVRLLDAPLHEFLEDSHEQNPMLGLRGVRLALAIEGLYRTQSRALLEAAALRRAAGGSPIIEIMVPLVALTAELATVRPWIDAEIEAAGDAGTVKVGTMIETPRAALRAGGLAPYADFMSFGTNDLTQMTFGFSRDDVESSVIGEYLKRGLLQRSPFEALDTGGVGELISMAVERARAVDPDMKIGICGEHGGDPRSIAFVVAAGIDYVSCSGPRVPVARLAAAHALLGVT
jgi:pyruvate,orthophosphate dikinase